MLIHAAIWLQQISAENWWAVPLWGGAELGPHLTQRGAEAYLHAKFRLDPSVWPQCTNVTDRQDRTDMTDRQRTDSIGRTVLQTVAQKRLLFI